ncbi:MAG: oligosaccharide flippase family protein [Anaerolineaceae bacterium]|jgi:O-antigen/teichoic acid export membrane protein|nr:oligosaccharide flippase family protein [Anaerolineaceae bacterium]
MNFLKRLQEIWHEDRLLQGIIRNTGYLFSSNTITMVLGMAQSILAARLLGVAALGVLGTITVFASTVNRLFSFRMGDLVVKYFGGYLEEGDLPRAGSLIKVSASIESITSVVAFLVLLFLAPVAAVIFAKDPSLTVWFRVYGVFILGSLIDETAVAVLHVTDRFRSQAILNLAQSILTAVVIGLAFLLQAGLPLVLFAYLAGKIVLGFGGVFLAARSLRRVLGARWWRQPMVKLPPWGELARFAVSTNLSTTINLVVRDSEQLWVAYFLSPLAVGYYKIALAIVNMVVMPITPFISTTYPKISASVAGKKWAQLRSLLRRVTAISGAWTAASTLGLLVLGRLFIRIMYGTEFLPAYPILLVLLVGYGLANTCFWNRPLLLAFGKPMVPFYAMAVFGLIKVGLAFSVVPAMGAMGEAILLSGYFVFSVGWIVLAGLRELRRGEQASLAAEAAG